VEKVPGYQPLPQEEVATVAKASVVCGGESEVAEYAGIARAGTIINDMSTTRVTIEENSLFFMFTSR
jgi:hypothetical protein